MRILFGVQGTGNGHISRSRTLARALKARGIEVDYLFSGRAADGYFEMGEFGEYRTFPGISFVSHQGCISGWRTLKGLSPLRFWQDMRALDCRDYDLVISDFEPLSAHAARRWQKTSLTISHQASFDWPIPRWGESGFNRQLMRHFAPVSRSLGLHWFHFGQPLLPPIIDPMTPVPDNQQILVYLPFEQTEQIAALLSRFSQQRFVCFHPGLRKASQWRNIRFEPAAREGFKLALAGCRGVISNAGFELASEALSLGKKLLGQAAGRPVRAADQRQDPGADRAGPVDGDAGCQCGESLAGGTVTRADPLPRCGGGAGRLAAGRCQGGAGLSLPPPVGQDPLPGGGVRSPQRTGGQPGIGPSLVIATQRL
jgi:uncharacterized protein (TIGR00661 family)